MPFPSLQAEQSSEAEPMDFPARKFAVANDGKNRIISVFCVPLVLPSFNHLSLNSLSLSTLANSPLRNNEK
jgi:hypothetical protein